MEALRASVAATKGKPRKAAAARKTAQGRTRTSSRR
jgi:hypothetical protein